MKGPLIGTYFHNVDEKGRLAVPSKMRTELGDPFYITCLTSDCLCIYSEDEWQEVFRQAQYNTTDGMSGRSVPYA